MTNAFRQNDYNMNVSSTQPDKGNVVRKYLTRFFEKRPKCTVSPDRRHPRLRLTYERRVDNPSISAFLTNTQI